MIIVLLLFFQSICLYCQRLVLHVYDRWINPKNVRLLKEAAELTGNRKLLQQPIIEPTAKNKRKRYTTSASGTVSESCSFCANTPKGYCRHHLYLQELEIQRQQRSWNPLSERESEYRQWRKANRELKRNLKNRFLVQQQHQQEQSQQQLRRQTRLQNLSSEVIYTNSGCHSGGNINVLASGDGGGSPIDTISSNSSNLYTDSGYHSASQDTTITPPTLNSPSGSDSIETIYYFEPLLSSVTNSPSSSSSPTLLASSKLNSGSYTRSLTAPVSLSTSYL